MAKITLDVENKNVDIVMTILQNLKEGLVNEITLERKRSYNKPKRIEPAEPLQPSPQPVSISTGKYVDPKTFKERLKRMKR